MTDKKSPLECIDNEKDAHLYSLGLWEWLSETGETFKLDYDERLEGILNRCTLCHYFYTTYLRCEHCCLKGNQFCKSGTGKHYEGWDTEDDIENRKFHARKIYEQIKSKCEKEGWV